MDVDVSPSGLLAFDELATGGAFIGCPIGTCGYIYPIGGIYIG